MSPPTGRKAGRAIPRPRSLRMKKAYFYIALFSATLGLAACDKTPEDKMESARESARDAGESMGDAARKTGDAIEQKVEER
jgi:hypothetical protein